MPRRLSRNEITDRIKKVHGDNVQIDFSTFKNTSSTCRFVDKDYGEFWNIPYNVYACGQRSRQRFIEKTLKKPVSHIQKQIDKVHNGKIKIIESTYTGSDKKCKFIDEDYGEFWTYPFNTIHHKQRHPNRKKITVEKYLVKGTERKNSETLRRLVLENELLEYICKECDQKPTWRGKPLVLDLHHINGDCGDNRIENLCFLCPHCHTQTPTYKGKNGI